MSIPSTFTSRKLLEPAGTFTYLGTMPGNQSYQTYSGRYTYCREYIPFINADQLREKLYQTVQRSPETMRDLGYQYSGAIKTGGLKGGDVYFRVLKTLSKEKSNRSSLEYVIGQLRDELQGISGLTKKELIQLFDAYGPHYLIHHFLDPVVFPQQKDIVIFPEVTLNAPVHYGLFKETKYGTLESKLPGNSNPFITESEMYFNPFFVGNRAYFFRVKTERVSIESLAIKFSLQNHSPAPLLTSNQTYTVQEEGSLTFNVTDKNLAYRHIIDQYYNESLAKKLPEIRYLSHVRFFGMCYQYAFGKILETYSSSAPFMPNPEGWGKEILAKYFRVTLAPQKGALMVYFDYSQITHWAIYLGDGRGESKWGSDGVYQHRLFDVSTRYGNTLRFFEPLFPPAQLVELLSQDLETLCKTGSRNPLVWIKGE